MNVSTYFIAVAVGAFGFLSFNDQPQTSTHLLSDVPPIQNFSTNPPVAKTGAPGESNCTDCHSGSVLSAQGVVTLTGLSADYVPGQTYNLSISVSSGVKNGFEMVILDDSDQQAGSFTNGAHTGTIVSNGREYIRHSASNTNSFDFDWTAPSTDMGDLTVYYAFNKSDNGGSTANDEIYLGTASVNSSVTASILKKDHDPFKIVTAWNAGAKQINLNYQLAQPAQIMVNVQSLNGKLIQRTVVGQQEAGQYQNILDGGEISPGVYIVSVFVDNQVFNKKMLLY